MAHAGATAILVEWAVFVCRHVPLFRVHTGLCSRCVGRAEACAGQNSTFITLRPPCCWIRFFLAPTTTCRCPNLRENTLGAQK